MRRSPFKRKPPPPGFTEATRRIVQERSEWQCEAHTPVCTQWAFHLHHKLLRRHGDHSPGNALHVCFPCHEFIHANPLLSYGEGWLVRSKGRDAA